MSSVAGDADWAGVLDKARNTALGRPLAAAFFPHHHTVAELRLRMNNGSFGACPAPVLERQASYRAQWMTNPDGVWAGAFPHRIERARACVAHQVAHCALEDLILVDNVTMAVGLVHQWLYDDILRHHRTAEGQIYAVLVSNMTYRAVGLSVQAVVDRLACVGITLNVHTVQIPFPVSSREDVVAAYTKTLEECAAASSESLRLCCLDHIVSNPGMVLPVEVLANRCYSHGAKKVFVDGAHAPGMIPTLDLAGLPCDFYCANLHKWMFTPTGTGFLYVRNSAQMDVHHPLHSHNYGVNSDETCRDGLVGGLPGEARMVGTRDYSPFLTIPDAVEFYDACGGSENVAARNCALALEAGTMCATLWGTQLGTPGDMVGSTCMVGLPRIFGSTWEDSKRFKMDLYDWSCGSTESGEYSGIVVQYPYPTLNDRLWVRISAAGYNDMTEFRVFAEAVVTLADQRRRTQL